MDQDDGRPQEGLLQEKNKISRLTKHLNAYVSYSASPEDRSTDRYTGNKTITNPRANKMLGKTEHVVRAHHVAQL